MAINMNHMIILLNLIIIFLLFYFIDIFINKYNRKENRFFHFVLYSKNDYFGEMYRILSLYYKKFKNVKTIFYAYSNEIKSDYYLENDILYIKGEETFIPGILNKTLEAFTYFKDEYKYYDYIVRSNISTIVNFDLLKIDNNMEYGGGGILNKLNSLSPNYGINDKKYLGLVYASGTSMIFSRNMIYNIINNKDKINKEIIDDVSLALFIKEFYNIEPEMIGNGNNYIMIPDFKRNKQLLVDYIKKNTIDNKNNKNNKNIIFYRNRNKNRNDDVYQMKEIIEYISKK